MVATFLIPQQPKEVLKVFYNAVYALRGKQWTKIGELPHALAYGVSITTQEGIVCLGGNDGKHSSDKVFLLKTKGTSQKEVTTTSLPALPLPLDNFAGAAAPDGTIYIAGGQSNGVASQQAFRLTRSKTVERTSIDA